MLATSFFLSTPVFPYLVFFNISNLFFEGDLFFLLVGVLGGFAGFFDHPFAKIGLAYKQI